VGDGVDAPLPQLLAKLGVPVVLHVVVRPPRQLVRNQRPPACAKNTYTYTAVLVLNVSFAKFSYKDKRSSDFRRHAIQIFTLFSILSLDSGRKSYSEELKT
jgi:hypothetical protein